MASIDCRKRKDGTKTWRVRFRRNGYKPLLITFISKEDAEKWAIEHEEAFYERPDFYHQVIKDMLIVAKKVENRKKWMKRLK